MSLKFLKQGLSIIAIAAIAATSSFAGQKMSNSEIQVLQKKFPNLVGKRGISVVKGESHGKFKQLELEVATKNGPQVFNVFVVDGLEEVIFAGNAFKPDGEKYSLPLDTSVINAGVAFKMGHGPKQVYLATDPECPYCIKFEKALKPGYEKEYTINVIPMPLSFHKKAKPMLQWILSSADNDERSKRMHSVMLGDKSWESFVPTKEQKLSAEKEIAEGIASSSELRVSGTPSLYNNKFEKINPAPLMAPDISQFSPANIKAVEEGVAFTIGNGPQKVYLVTDPECPYCQKLEKAITPAAMKKFTVSVIPYQLSFHKKAKPMLAWVMSASTEVEKANRMHAAMTGDQEWTKFKPTNEDNSRLNVTLEKSKNAAAILKFKGTPAMFDNHFNSMSAGLLTQP